MKTSHRENAIKSLVSSYWHGKMGRIPEAKRHINKAHEHFGEHLKELTMDHKHDEVKSEVDKFNGYFHKLDYFLDHAKKTIKKSEILINKSISLIKDIKENLH